MLFLFVITYTYLSVDSSVVLIICKSCKFVYHYVLSVFFLSLSLCFVFVCVCVCVFCFCFYLFLSVSLCKFFCRPSGLLHEVILIRAMVPACSWYYFSVLTPYTQMDPFHVRYLNLISNRVWIHLYFVGRCVQATFPVLYNIYGRQRDVSVLWSFWLFYVLKIKYTKFTKKCLVLGTENNN